MIIFLLLFVGLPVFELYLLIQVGSRIGALPTIGLTILTAVIGGVLVRLQGLSVLGRVRASLDRGDVPALEMLGFLLLLPGFVTDAIGFLLLVPVVRRLVIARYVQVIPRHSPSGADEGPRVIEGEFRRDD
ncbi:MAG: FxsA family protein [Chromatiaceae bacterium]